MRWCRLCMMLLSQWAACHVQAQAVEGGHTCASIARSTERLACYDRAFPPSEQARAAIARQAIEDFGMPARLASGPGQAGEDTADRIEAKVVKVEYLASGERTLDLDNGQRWHVTEATSRGHLREGDGISVRKGVMGNYLLTTSAGVGLRARRVR